MKIEILAHGSNTMRVASAWIKQVTNVDSSRIGGYQLEGRFVSSLSRPAGIAHTLNFPLDSGEPHVLGVKCVDSALNVCVVAVIFQSLSHLDPVDIYLPFATITMYGMVPHTICLSDNLKRRDVSVAPEGIIDDVSIFLGPINPYQCAAQVISKCWNLPRPTHAVTVLGDPLKLEPKNRIDKLTLPNGLVLVADVDGFLVFGQVEDDKKKLVSATAFANYIEEVTDIETFHLISALLRAQSQSLAALSQAYAILAKAYERGLSDKYS